MATKTNLISLFLVLSSGQLFANNDKELLSNWTKESEQKLNHKYKIISTEKFQVECLKLARSMQLNKIEKCDLFESSSINAYVFNNGHVYFSLSLMELINNKHQWASILAHESAHIELNHYIKNLQYLQNPPVFFPKKKYRKQLKKHEQQADDWAIERLKKYKFKPNQIYFFLKRAEKLKGNKKNKTHLKFSKRMKNNKSKEIISADFSFIYQQ